MSVLATDSALFSLSGALNHSPTAAPSPAPASQAVNPAEKQLLLCISILTNDGAFLPVGKKQALGKAAGKSVAERLHAYERIVSIQENAFQRAMAAQQRAYQKASLAQLSPPAAPKKNGIGTAYCKH